MGKDSSANSTSDTFSDNAISSGKTRKTQFQSYFPLGAGIAPSSKINAINRTLLTNKELEGRNARKSQSPFNKRKDNNLQSAFESFAGPSKEPSTHQKPEATPVSRFPTCANSPCFPGVTCEPSEKGSFRCGRCPFGYYGDGITCRGMDNYTNVCFANNDSRYLMPNIYSSVQRWKIASYEL